MKYQSSTVKEYIDQLPEDRQKAIKKLRSVINKNIPKGFKEQINYNMIGWVVPHSLYPEGYHCKPSDPLPFMHLASQKNFVAVYHSGIYADEQLMAWFVKEYHKRCDAKLDMGKSCIRFKKMEKIPYDLIGELASLVSPTDWIARYEEKIKR